MKHLIRQVSAIRDPGERAVKVCRGPLAAHIASTSNTQIDVSVHIAGLIVINYPIDTINEATTYSHVRMGVELAPSPKGGSAKRQVWGRALLVLDRDGCAAESP